MGFDRYSDDQKIVVRDGNGNFEFDCATFKIDSDYLNLQTLYKIEASANDLDLTVTNFSLVSSVSTSITSSGDLVIGTVGGGTTSINGDIIEVYYEDPKGILLDKSINNIILKTRDWAPGIAIDDSIYLSSEHVNVVGTSFSVNSTSTISLDSDMNVNISSTGSTGFSAEDLTIVTYDDLTFDISGDINFSKDTSMVVPSNLKITGNNSDTNSYILTVENTSDSDNADLLKLDLPNLYVDWTDDSASLLISPHIGGGNNFIGFWAYGNKIAEIEGVGNQSDSDLQSSGSGYSGVRFINGSPSDFAEWLGIANLDEWNFSAEIISAVDKFKKKVLPIPEGTVVYIRNKKINKFGPGTPMIISHRAAFVGNSSKIHSEYGAIVSFCGQVPVSVSGPTNDGDYLVPVNNCDYCIAISPEDITFNDYKAVIGTCWESNQSSEIKKVNCAIGIK